MSRISKAARKRGWLCFCFAAEALTAPLSRAQCPVKFDPPVVLQPGGGGQATSVVAVDFNFDGNLDLVATQWLGQVVWVLLGDGKRGFRTERFPAGGIATPVSLAVGDFDQDGKPDLVVATHEQPLLWVYLGLGAGPWNPFFYRSHTGVGFTGVTVGDFNGDGRPDIAATASNSIFAIVNVGSFPPRSADTFLSSGLSELASGDFDRDRKDDLAVITPTGVAVVLSNGDGTFRPTTTYSVGVDPRSIVVADFNGDRNPDLAVASSGSGDVTVLLGNGDGSFQAPTAYLVGGICERADAEGGCACGAVSGKCAVVVVGDVDGDGRLDLIVTEYYKGMVAVLRGNGDGTFQTPLEFPAGPQPVGIALGDFDHDGLLDIAIANDFYYNTITVLFQTQRCPADFDHSCSVTGQDVAVFLSAWFANCSGQAGSPCNGRTADFNRSGTITVQDLFDFLSAWFVPCN